MRSQWLITFRSVTFAQRAERALQRHNIACQLQRTPKMLTSRGCGYCLRLQSDEIFSAVENLQEAQILYGKLYRLDDDGTPKEWPL